MHLRRTHPELAGKSGVGPWLFSDGDELEENQDVLGFEIRTHRYMIFLIRELRKVFRLSGNTLGGGIVVQLSATDIPSVPESTIFN
jgi:hypothetical protein